MLLDPAGIHGGNDQEATRCWQNHKDTQEEGCHGTPSPVSDPCARQRKSWKYVLQSVSWAIWPSVESLQGVTTSLFSTWNDVTACLFIWITWLENTFTLKVLVFHLQENVLPHKWCMRQQHKLPLRPRTPGSTCWSASGSTCGCWLWTEGGNSMMLWTDWRR